MAAEVSGSGEVIKTVQQFWDLTPEQKSHPQDFSLDCLVAYFDPTWRILFILDSEGNGAYVPYGDNAFPFKAGEAITAQGRFIPPNADINFEHASITSRKSAGPLPTLDATQDVTQYAQLLRKFVSVEGYVDRERRADAEHLNLMLTVNGEAVMGWVLMDSTVATPNLTDMKIRMTGVYNAKIGPDGSLSSTLEIMVPSMKQITKLHALDEDPGFKLPVSSIGGIIGKPSSQLVRVVGLVVERDPGIYVRIRDTTGQIELRTGQMRSLDINDTVEAIGFPVTTGSGLQLRSAVFRAPKITAATSSGAELAPGTIGLAADLLKLSAAEAKAGRPVWLTGVVTWSHPFAPFFFIHDSSGGVCVMRGESTSGVRSPGRNLEVRGVTAMGPFAPVVVASSFERVSDAVLPVARLISVEHALTGVAEAQWVEMRGYLRRIYREGEWNYLELATSGGDFIAVLPLTEDVSSLVGSVIKLQGVCNAEADASRKLTGIKLWVPGISFLQVDEPAPADPFTLPLRSLASLGQFEMVQSFNRRLRVEGVVLHQSPGHSIHLQKDGDSLLVLSRDSTLLRPGERIEAVGFLGRQAGRITLREAVYRSQGMGPQPEPEPFEPQKEATTELDGKLVSITGVVIDSSRVGEVSSFTLKTKETLFPATLERSPAGFSVPKFGSQLAVTGVYEVEYDDLGRAVSFGLRLRSPADVVVLESPSWWTRTRIQVITAVLAFGAVLFLGWITVLQRQVHRQTSQIRTQLEREANLQTELARAGKLESLGLLAGGIAHDFNNLLTVLMGNISLIRLDSALGKESAESLAQAEKAAIRARDLTQQLLTFAKGGAPMLAAVSLAETVREVAEFALHGSKVRIQFDLPADLWPANVDKGQIGQVVQNIVINAIQAMPEGGVMDIALSNQEIGSEMSTVLIPGRYVRLDMTDHGQGIGPSDLVRIFDPYFTTKKQGSGLGLATVHSIVKKHSGHITVESGIGQGTTFHIWLPAAAPGVPVVKPVVGRVKSSPAAGAIRVLVMDDEQFIRDLACSILRRHGYQSMGVADGAAAVAEYDRARQAGEPYALVIIDLTIPGGMGGREAMEQLLKLDPEVKAIVSSGYSNDLVLANYQAHGFRGMVSKPYDVADFSHAVDRVLKGERA